jgi:hypothetical protein
LSEAENGTVAQNEDSHLLDVDVDFDVFRKLGDGPSCCHALVKVLAKSLAALLGLKTGA